MLWKRCHYVAFVAIAFHSFGTTIKSKIGNEREGIEELTKKFYLQYDVIPSNYYISPHK